LQDVSTTAGFFADWGVPLPTLNVYLAGKIGSVGGLPLLGVASRLVTFPLIVAIGLPEGAGGRLPFPSLRP
jgi:hypothetical protein